MECVEVVESEKEGEVVEEVRAGYKLEDKVIRVAQVKVGKKDINKKAEELAKEQLQKGDYM
jgi:ribosomal protein S6